MALFKVAKAQNSEEYTVVLDPQLIGPACLMIAGLTLMLYPSLRQLAYSLSGGYPLSSGRRTTAESLGARPVCACCVPPFEFEINSGVPRYYTPAGRAPFIDEIQRARAASEAEHEAEMKFAAPQDDGA